MSLAEIYREFLKGSGLSIDSRSVKSGELYLAIRGDRFDGNDYAVSAIEKGATLAIVDREIKHERAIQVENSLLTLQALARHHRRQLDIPIVAITGSNGKTTTKNLTAALLGAKYSVHSTAGNFNNHMGLPLTILRITKHTDIAILEMGANHPGEIAELCSIAEPGFGLITNIGRAHLEGFGSLEGVRNTKFELCEFLMENDGVFFHNSDEKSLSEVTARFPDLKKTDISKSTGPKLIQQDPFLEIELWNEHLKTQIYGAYNLPNITCAVAIARYFNVSKEGIITALGTFSDLNNRSEIIEIKNWRLILDAYNANPDSVISALRDFSKIPSAKVLFLGDMLELGDETEARHAEILEFVKGLDIDVCHFVGPHFKAHEKTNSGFHFHENLNSIQSWLEKTSAEEYTALVKGSRSLKMERILDFLNKE